MSSYRTRVHIAGPVEGNVQRCARCGMVLVDAGEAMALDDARLAYWREGTYVGLFEGVRGAGNQFFLYRDATGSDEVACGGVRGAAEGSCA